MSVVTQIEYKFLDDVKNICKTHDKCFNCPLYEVNNVETGAKQCIFAHSVPSAWNITKIMDKVYNHRER